MTLHPSIQQVWTLYYNILLLFIYMVSPTATSGCKFYGKCLWQFKLNPTLFNNIIWILATCSHSLVWELVQESR